MLIDVHTHLDQYPDNEIPGIIERAMSMGVNYMVVAGTTIASSQAIVNLATHNPQIFASVGVHPTEIQPEFPQALMNELRIIASHPEVIAISEVGLDYPASNELQKIQIDAFSSQIRLGVELSLPIIYHSRNAYPTTLDILKAEDAQVVGGIAHYFQGTIETAYQCIELGFLISLAKPLLYLETLKEVAKEIPLTHIVLETDSHPQPFKKNREKWTEPKLLLEIAQTLADLKNVSIQEVVDITTVNAVNKLQLRKIDKFQQ
jgi:TatD DNase family protein